MPRTGGKYPTIDGQMTNENAIKGQVRGYLSRWIEKYVTIVGKKAGCFLSASATKFGNATAAVP